MDRLLRIASRFTPALTALALAACASGAVDESREHTIAPGHEDLVLAMVNTDLPEGCSLEGASIDRVLVRARYRCESAAPEIVLRHPSTSQAEPRTPVFAIEASPDAPRALVDRVASAVRANEARFHWDVRTLPGAPPPPSTIDGRVVAGLVAGGLALIGIVAALVVRRRRARS